jgi:ribosomal protein S18 acetylase RimI-like enzyme
MLYEAANKPGEPWPSFDDSMDDPRNRRFWNGLMTREGDLGVIAEVDGLSVGAAWIRVMGEGERGPQDDPEIPLLAIGVERDYRGRGIGSRLMWSLLDLARERGVRAIDLTVGSFNARAVQLYHRCAFQEVDTRGDTIRMRATLD